MEIRVSVPYELKKLIQERAEDLNISSAEYLRTLADLDISIQRYQSLSLYLNVLYTNICDIQTKLDMVLAPIQKAPIFELEN